MNKNPPDLYESWEVDRAVSRFSLSVSIMASRCLPSGMVASQFSMKVSAIAAEIYHEYQQGNASAEATIDVLSSVEWQLRKQADLISRFGLETITLMMQKHGGGARFTTASAYRYAQSKEKPQVNGWADWGRWTRAPHARKNLLLRYAAESYLDDLRDKQLPSGGNSGDGDISTCATPPSEPAPQPAPEAKKLTTQERLAKQRRENYLASEKTMQMLAAREAAKKEAEKEAAKTIPQVFAKSACVPAGTCDVGTEREALSSVGHYGAYAAAIAQDSEGMVLSRIAGQALADIPGMTMKIIGRAGILAAFAPTKMGDGTLYSEDDIRQRDTVETNIRFGVDPSGKLYGYHVDGDPIPKRTVTQSGDKFAVTLEDGLTLEWIPISGDFGGHPILINPIPDLERHDIWIHPQAAQGKEFDSTYITPVADADLNDYILVFPADTGLSPLYVVYKESPRNESGIVTGNGEDVTGLWLEAAGKELGSPVPSQIADKLRGREFSNFDGFRKAFWIEVSKNPELRNQFSVQNQLRMELGKAPKARSKDKIGKRNSFELHHVEEIQHDGKVYDVDNLRVNTPKNHIDIHKKSR